MTKNDIKNDIEKIVGKGESRTINILQKLDQKHGLDSVEKIDEFIRNLLHSETTLRSNRFGTLYYNQPDNDFPFDCCSADQENILMGIEEFYKDRTQHVSKARMLQYFRKSIDDDEAELLLTWCFAKGILIADAKLKDIRFNKEKTKSI